VRSLLALSFWLMAAGIGAAQTPNFSSKVEAVRVDVLVLDKGQPVVGLIAGDFEILDNGVPQTVDLASFEEIPLNVVLVLDMSDSVAGDRLDRLRTAAGALLPALKEDDQAALVSFSQLVRLGAGLAKQRDPLRAALAEAAGNDNTSLIDATYAGIMVGESDVGRSLVIVFSDGLDTASWLTADAVIDVAKRSDVVVYGVSIRSSQTPEFLRDLTSTTGGRLLEVERTSNLDAIFLGVLEEFRRRYLVSFTPRGVAANGWHRLEVRVRRNAIVRARPGYLASP
jgi:VWFA-related protein